MNDRVLTDGWMNGWTDTQNFKWYKIPSHFLWKSIKKILKSLIFMMFTLNIRSLKVNEHISMFFPTFLNIIQEGHEALNCSPE